MDCPFQIGTLFILLVVSAKSKDFPRSARLAGTIEVEGRPTTVLIAGNYTVEKADGLITLTMIPAQVWQLMAMLS